MKLTNKQRCKNCIHKCVCHYPSYYENVEGLERCKHYYSKERAYAKKDERRCRVMAACKDCLYYDVCPLGLAANGRTGACLKFKILEDPKYTKLFKKHFRWNKTEIQNIKTRSKIKYRTNNAKGKDGLRSGIVVFDEVHAYENWENINVNKADIMEKHDCEKCKHFGKHATQYPCSHCKNCYTDKFEADTERNKGEMKYYMTYEDAVSVLPDDEYIHTFYNNSFGLVGADWSRSEILNKLKEADVVIELTGEQARNMKHGMCVYKKNAKYQSEILFIETDESKLVMFEKNHSADKGGAE